MNTEDDASIFAAERALDFCISEFEKRSERKVSDEIDRVFAIVAPDKIDLLYTRGETGDFGIRDSDLKAFFLVGF